MKKKSIFFILSLITCSGLTAQTKPVSIVFDVTSKDTLVHQTTVRHVSLMAAAYPDSKFEIVIYGGSLPMVVNDQSKVASGISKLLERKNVSVKVCKVTMDRYKINKSQLFHGVEVIPDGIMEIVTKQGEGWGYIKEAN